MNMTDIDFSKAPEGATHYEHFDEGVIWLKTVLDYWHAKDESTDWSSHLHIDSPYNPTPIPRMRTEHVKDERQEWIDAAITAADLKDLILVREPLGKIYDAGLANKK